MAIKTGEVIDLPLGDLRYGPQVRAERIDLDHMHRLIPVIDECPPIQVRPKGPSYEVLDGFHRWNAAKNAGRETIRGVVVECGEDEALAIAIGANVTHGSPLSAAERKSCARRLILSTSFSDRRIATVCGIHHDTVATIRAKSAGGSTGLNPPVDPPKRTGSDGVQRAPRGDALARARAVVEDKPDASLNEIQSEAGVGRSAAVAAKRAPLAAAPDPSPDVSVAEVVRSAPSPWKDDPACLASNAGRDFGRFMDHFASTDFEKRAEGLTCPPALIDGAVMTAECMATNWTNFANRLRKRPNLEVAQ